MSLPLQAKKPADFLTLIIISTPFGTEKVSGRYRYSCSPRKYCRYGFMAISLVISSSDKALYAGLIRSAPSAILESIALWPFLLLKLSAYFRSNSRQGTSLLSLIQSLFGSSGNEPNISGDSSMETCPVCRLYILSSPAGARFLMRIP